MTGAGERVSVVIPTRARAPLVSRAVRSALDQTLLPLEILVVVDGPDRETVEVLERIGDDRIEVVALPESLGGSAARNAGIRAARGDWIAFLDDDDEWLPGKLAMQMELARRSNYRFPVVSCRVIARTPGGDFVWPRKMPGPPGTVSEYLFVRTSLFQGEGLLPTTTLLARKPLLETVPFRHGLKKHQDWDWLLRVARHEGVGFEVVPGPQAIWYIEEPRPSVGAHMHWQYSLDWLRGNRELVTPRAYAGFVATQVAPQAARTREWRAFVPLLLEMCGGGRPRPIDFLLYLGMWIMPQDVRRRIRATLRKSRA